MRPPTKNHLLNNSLAQEPSFACSSQPSQFKIWGKSVKGFLSYNWTGEDLMLAGKPPHVLELRGKVQDLIDMRQIFNPMLFMMNDGVWIQQNLTILFAFAYQKQGWKKGSRSAMKEWRPDIEEWHVRQVSENPLCFISSRQDKKTCRALWYLPYQREKYQTQDGTSHLEYSGKCWRESVYQSGIILQNSKKELLFADSTRWIHKICQCFSDF